MALVANKTQSSSSASRVEQPVLDVGNYPGRLVQIIDLGVQLQRPYQGQEKPPAHEIMLTYELVDSFMVDANGKELEDKPRWISETFPLRSLEADKAKSTQRYKALDPSSEFDGDFSRCIGVPVNVTIVHGGINKNTNKPYENVGNISTMRARDAEKCPELVNPPKVFDLDNPDMKVFTALPQWLQEKIKGNLHYKGSKLEALAGAPAKKEESKKPEPQEEEEEQDERPW